MISCSFDWSDFLQQHWQRRPCLLRQAFPDFQDPISPDELAGLAMEPVIDSRVVARRDSLWTVEQGPFSDFSHWGEVDWCLLVQAVDHWSEQVAELMSPFRQLPNWRLEDLMVSFSVPGGGVGPHVDQYDVFIIQGQGQRRWRIGAKAPLRAHCPHPDLLQVEPFEAELDVILEPGDMLYIPPGFPHEGYAISQALNYSVGFRAPNQRELLSGFADFLLEHELGNERYADPELQPDPQPGRVDERAVNQLRDMMTRLVADEPRFREWLGEFLSQPRHELDLAPAEPPYLEGEIYDRLLAGAPLRRLGGLRCLYLAPEPDLLFIKGETWPVPAGGAPLARLLSDSPLLESESLGKKLSALLAQPAVLAWLTELINEGYWYFPEDEDDLEEA